MRSLLRLATRIQLPIVRLVIERSGYVSGESLYFLQSLKETISVECKDELNEILSEIF